MFTNKEKRLLGGGYFTIIREEENFIEVRSNNTKHQWIIFKKSFDSNKPITLYHKHTADTKYYHKHFWCECEESVGDQNLDDYEKEAEFTLRYVDIDEAIKVNSEYKTDVFFNEIMIRREKKVLELIKENL